MNIHELIKLLGMIWEDLNLRIMKYLLMKVIEYPYDDKRYILLDGIHTLPYGHKDIPTRNW